MLIPLSLSILILLLAPLFGPWMRRNAPAWQSMDGFVVTVVLGILMFNILPPVMESKNLWAPVLFILGLALPTIAEQFTHSRQTHRLVISVPAIAIILHAVSDGSLLRLIAEDPEGSGIATGIILHRLGLATAMWWLVVSNHGNKLGWIFMILMSAATLLGYSGTDILLDAHGETSSPLIQAFAAGSLLHILLHPLEEENLHKGRGHGMHRIGTTIGLLVVAGIVALHFHGHTAVIDAGVDLHDHSQSPSLDRMLHLGASLSSFLLALSLVAFWVKRLKALAMASLIIWLIAFAIIPYDALPYSDIGIWILSAYGLVMALHFITAGGRSVIAALVPQSTHTHKH